MRMTELTTKGIVIKPGTGTLGEERKRSNSVSDGFCIRTEKMETVQQPSQR